jgi:hypothetical protein
MSISGRNRSVMSGKEAARFRASIRVVYNAISRDRALTRLALASQRTSQSDSNRRRNKLDRTALAKAQFLRTGVLEQTYGA